MPLAAKTSIVITSPKTTGLDRLYCPVVLFVVPTALVIVKAPPSLVNNISGVPNQVKSEFILSIRDYQMHPVRNTIQHIDFQRINENEKIHVKVPFHFVNAEVSPGVKLNGGIVAHIMTEANISCLPKNLPEFIEVDLAALDIGQSVHLSQIKVAEGVEFVQLSHGNDAAVASVAKPKVVVEEVVAKPVEGEADAADPAADGAKPAEGAASADEAKSDKAK